MSLCDIVPHFFCGVFFIRSFSIFCGVLCFVRPTLWVIRFMCVSTTNPSFFLKMFQSMTFAVFLPTPGSFVSEFIV